MRWVICALVVLLAPAGARAGDFDVLRGAQPVGYATYTRWSGFYGGGLIGEEFDAADFRNIGQSEIQTISGLSAIFDGIPLTNFPRLNSLNTNTSSYSAFAGYNYQFEAAVVGLEFNFTKTAFSAGINDVESHSYFTTVNNTIYDTAYTVTTGASAKLNDSASLRGRLGWAFNNFLPYGFAGVTVAQIDATKFVNVTVCGEETPYDCTNPPPPNPTAAGAGRRYLDDSRSSHRQMVLRLRRGIWPRLRPDSEYLPARRTRIHAICGAVQYQAQRDQRTHRRWLEVLIAARGATLPRTLYRDRRGRC